MASQPVIEPGGGARHQREQRVLGRETLVHRRWLEKYDEGRASEAIERVERTKALQHVHREGLGLFRIEQPPKAPWQQSIDTHEVDAPHLTVLTEAVGVQRRKMQRHQ